MKRLLAVFAVASSLWGQAANLHISASTIGSVVSKAMFGRLPKEILAAQVLACNDSAQEINVPLARIQQQLKPSGYTVLAPDAALAVIAASQGRSGMATALRWGVAAASLAAVAASWSTLSAATKNTLEASALVGGQSLGIVSTAIPTHTYLTLQSEGLPDPLSIPAGGCAKPGIVLAEINPATRIVDLSVIVPVAK